MERWETRLHVVDFGGEKDAEEILLNYFDQFDQHTEEYNNYPLHENTDLIRKRLLFFEIQKILRFLNSNIPLNLQLERIMDGLLTVFQTQRGFIALYDPEDNRKIKITRNFSKDVLDDEKYFYLHDIIDLVEKKPGIVYYDVFSQPVPEYLLQSGMPLESLLCCSIGVGKKINGVYYLENIDSSWLGQESIEDVAQIFAHLIAMAVKYYRPIKLTKPEPESMLTLKPSVTEQDMRQTNLAEKVGHELNNKISAIRGNLDLAKRTLEKRGDVLAALNRMSQVEKLVEKLEKFSFSLMNNWQMEPEFSQCDLNLLVSDFIYTIEPVYRESGVTFRKEFAPSLPTIKVDKSQIEQVLHNIVRNAIEARTDAFLTIRTIYDERNDMVLLSISDNGPGIKKENLSKIFMPFFTTKPHGHGFGLHLCKEIIAKHGGEISVRSKQGQGTEFTISLPVK